MSLSLGITEWDVCQCMNWGLQHNHHISNDHRFTSTVTTCLPLDISQVIARCWNCGIFSFNAHGFDLMFILTSLASWDGWAPSSMYLCSYSRLSKLLLQSAGVTPEWSYFGRACATAITEISRMAPSCQGAAPRLQCPLCSGFGGLEKSLLLSTTVRKRLEGFYGACDFLRQQCRNDGFEVRNRHDFSSKLCAFYSPDCPHSPALVCTIGLWVQEPDPAKCAAGN